VIEYETETQPLNPEAERIYELFMGMQVEEWLFFISKVEGGATFDKDTEAAFNRAFGQRGRGDDRNA
jgi:hypothetical protein